MGTRTDFLGRSWAVERVGCAIADGSMGLPGGLVAKTAHFVLHQDPDIPLPGFLVLGSKRHVQSMASFSEAEFREFVDLLRIGHRAIKDHAGVQHLTVVQEEYSTHFHLWFFPWTDEVMAKYGDPSLGEIRRIMRGFRTADPIQDSDWHRLLETIEQIRVDVSAALEL